jgi:integrase
MLKPLQVTRAKARQKPYKLTDTKGLHLYVSPTGARSWRYSFRFGGRAQLLSIGLFPDISLKRARLLHADARRQLAEGRNPAQLKQQQKEKAPESGTFKALAEQWYSALEAERSESWRYLRRRWLDQRVYPEIGKKALKDVQAADVLAILKHLEREGKARSAESVRQMIGQIFDHAIRNLWVSFNPAQSLAGAVKPPKHVPHPHLSERELPDFLAKVEAYPDASLKLAVKLLFLTFVRKSELTGATWSEIDFDRSEWRIPASRMKGKREHLVPLGTQALECFQELKKLANGSDYVLPSPTKPRQPIGRSLLVTVFKELGGKISPHGVRATASSILNERSGFSGDVIEAQLAHVQGDQVRAAYNRAAYMEQRAKLMQWWSDYLDNARRGNVVQLPVRAA